MNPAKQKYAARLYHALYYSRGELADRELVIQVWEKIIAEWEGRYARQLRMTKPEWKFMQGLISRLKVYIQPAPRPLGEEINYVHELNFYITTVRKIYNNAVQQNRPRRHYAQSSDGEDLAHAAGWVATSLMPIPFL